MYTNILRRYFGFHGAIRSNRSPPRNRTSNLEIIITPPKLDGISSR